MAAVKTKLDTKLQVTMTTGETKDGKDLTRSLTFSKVKDDATADQLLAAGTAIGQLADKDLAAVRVSEVYSLTEQA